MGLPALIFFMLALLFSLDLASAEDPILYNVDCGAAEGYIANINKGGSSDGVSKLIWVGDGNFVRSGVAYNLSVPVGEDRTLRAFPKYKKNCYTFDVIANRKIQVWLNFSYSNYDGKWKPPVFKLIFDGGDWGEFDTGSRSSTTVIYVATRNRTDVCFGRMYDQDPFVSSMQVAVFAPEMYSLVNSTTAIYEPLYFAYGNGSGDILKYPDDHYDRYWLPTNVTDYMSSPTVLRREDNTTTVNTSLCADDPPTKIFNAAITPQGRAKSLNITSPFFAIGEDSPMYVNMYFSEMSSALSEKRSFNIFMDNVLISNSAHPIRPSYETATEFSYIVPNFTSNTMFTLSSTRRFTLPPIISGFEYSYIKEFSTRGTNLSDVNAITAFQKSFKALQPWSGDPCLPINYTWEWIGCDSADPPRITNLYLNSSGLNGTLPDFSALDALVTIDMHNNSLSGSIPDFLANMPNLKELNLAYNRFTSLPESLRNKTGIIVNTTGNPLSATPTPPRPHKEGSSSGAAINLGTGSRRVMLSILFCYICVMFA